MDARVVHGLMDDISAEDIFTPEDLSVEQKMLGNIVDEFVRGEIEPRIEELEHKEPGVMEELLTKSSTIGLLGIDVPEVFGGMGLDHVSSLVITERVMRGGPFGLTQLVHTAFGTIPILYFGNEEQKRRWLPDLATGKKIAAYALTEADAGSDARQIGTRATFSGDSDCYVVNGEKQFTSNSGLAHLFITFAKIDGEQYAAFVIDRQSRGISLNEEEKKMGVRGSSTRGIAFDSVEVPREGLLHRPGEGHVVAFNTLNIGRHRLAGACMGMAKIAFDDSLRYSRTRRQFGQAISNLGLIKGKLGEMAIRIFAGESVVYRTASLLNKSIDRFDKTSDIGEEMAAQIKEYSGECSINKVYASELLQYVTDAAVQIHGGYGYIEDYPIERYYRDARIYRIFGGTNEINRLLIARLVLERASKDGETELKTLLQKREALTLIQADESLPGGEVLKEQASLVEETKDIFLALLKLMLDAYPSGLEQQEQLMAVLSEIIMETFAMESCLLRSQKLHKRWGATKSEVAVAITTVYIEEAIMRLERWARYILVAAKDDGATQVELADLKALRDRTLVNMIALRRKIADFMLEAGRYYIC
jgi:alkylation response protein AidB-like acyl-CoA dehydrogenase